jgi:photosystem II stability/assembly factor-like uncharacterized protein
MMQKLARLGVAWLLATSLSSGSKLVAGAATQDPDESEKDVLKNLTFRNLGPAVGGGRVPSVVGIPGNPNVYYVGTAAGGVFKTEDSGITWKPIFEHESTASIGDVALAPSNPSVVWVGTGEGKIRNDVVDGHGVYVSGDAGHSWKFAGLADVGQISRIVVDPANPDVVFVAATGHAWGPNPDRGVFKTTDGGKTWKKVLFVNDSTGAADLVIQPGNPKVLFAGMWEFRRYPWTLVDGGPNSGIYRSTDGGETWKKLTKGLPEGPLGRIALAIAPTNPNHVYALVAAKRGMLWQSTDLGDTWTEVSNSHAYDIRPFYFSRLLVSPENENKIYFLSFNLVESDDGGKTSHTADRGVHSDHHSLWIDPQHPERMIQGNDGGVCLTTDGGKSWRFLNNLPIEQFYMVSASSETPYSLCGGLQDNSAWCGLSSNLGGRAVSGADWYTVTGGDGEYAVFAPSDPNIIYVDSQNGSISRLDRKTHISRFVRPYLPGVEEMKTADLKYRFNWTSPIAVSETNAEEIYLGGNVVFKTTDAGKTWTPISPDLTRNDKSKQEVAGGPVQHDISGAETYDTILCITVAPTDPKVMWVGTDDGLVHVTRDGGQNWTNVSVKGAPEWARVYQIGVSPFDAGTAYLAYDAHELDNRRPYVYKTTDYGKTWTSIAGGLPDDVPARVVRENPNQRGFLVLGTDTGLYYSQDSGAHWQPLKANFPTVPVYDLRFVQRDLVVATHGRGIWVLDNIRPLEALNSTIESSDFKLVSTAPGTLFHHWRTGFGGSAAEYSAANAPEGVIIDYYLKKEIPQGAGGRGGASGAGGPGEAGAQAGPAGAAAAPGAPGEQAGEEQAGPEGQPPGGRREGPVKIVIIDSQGNPVATEYGPSKAGINRFVWSMRYDPPERLSFERPQEVSEFAEFAGRGRGPLVLAGTYHVAITVAGHTDQADVTVQPDPNVKIDPSEFRAQLKFALEGRNAVSALNTMLNRVDGMQKTLAAFQATVRSSDDNNLKKKYEPLTGKARELGQKLRALKDSVYNSELQPSGEDSIHYLAAFNAKLSGLAGRGGFNYGQAPNQLALDEMAELTKELDKHLADFNQLIQTDVAVYNKEAFAAGAPTLYAGDPISVKKPAGI